MLHKHSIPCRQALAPTYPPNPIELEPSIITGHLCDGLDLNKQAVIFRAVPEALLVGFRKIPLLLHSNLP